MPAALQPISVNVERVSPITPTKQVKLLSDEVQKKGEENVSLRNTISDLTNALNGLNIVKEKIDVTGSTSDEKAKKTKKDKDAPVPAKTAYKFFCEASPDQEGDMRILWKECAPEIRKKYVDMAEDDKARFQRENAAYQEQKTALEMFYETKKQNAAMEFYEAHMAAQAALEKAAAEKKGKKAKKDPEAPKRPTSSFMYFASDKRESVAKKNPEIKVTEVSKLLGEMWSKLASKKTGQKKYDAMAAVDKARYEEEKAKYDAMIAQRNVEADQEKVDRLNQDKEEAMALMQTSKDASAKATSEAMSIVASQTDDVSVLTDVLEKKTKKKKDPNAPKRNSTAYIFFCTENRATIKTKMPENTPQAELLKEVGAQWKALDEKKKEKYVKMADTDKIRYTKEMESYTPPN